MFNDDVEDKEDDFDVVEGDDGDFDDSGTIGFFGDRVEGAGEIFDSAGIDDGGDIEIISFDKRRQGEPTTTVLSNENVFFCAILDDDLPAVDFVGGETTVDIVVMID